jgi:preprotein translocase subunit Sss1
MFNSNEFSKIVMSSLIYGAIFFMVVGMIIYIIGSCIFSHLTIMWN